MTILLSIFGLGILGIVILLLESVREGRDFVITRYQISFPEKGCENNKPNVSKVLLLSDLHDKEYGEKNYKLIEAIKSEKPELILIAGDMIIAKNGRTPEVALDLLENISKIAPVYYANGNHEQRVKEDSEKFGMAYDAYRKKLEAFGARILENETVSISLGGCRCFVSGLEIPSRYYEKCQYDRFNKDEMTTLLGEKPEGYHILLAHNPVHSEGYVQWGADLVLSGHLHGGIIRLPWIGGIITPQVKLLPKYSGGMYRLKDSAIVVSKGLGEHTVKIRFLNKPELVVLEFQGK